MTEYFTLALHFLLYLVIHLMWCEYKMQFCSLFTCKTVSFTKYIKSVIYAHSEQVFYYEHMIWFEPSLPSKTVLQQLFYCWCIKVSVMCYPVCGMVHIKDPLQLFRKSSYMTENKNVLCASLNKTFCSFHLRQDLILYYVIISDFCDC